MDFDEICSTIKKGSVCDPCRAPKFHPDIFYPLPPGTRKTNLKHTNEPGRAVLVEDEATDTCQFMWLTYDDRLLEID